MAEDRERAGIHSIPAVFGGEARWQRRIIMMYLASVGAQMNKKSNAHTESLPRNIIRTPIPVISRRSRNSKRLQKLIMY